jgi:tRNA pseudouridine38-40 synthase
LAYDGAAYHGWQVQPGAVTVQGRILEAVRPLARGAIRVVGASRTDAGVHALGQVASVQSPEPLVPASVMAALNARLPRDIRVLAARAVPDGFDARRSARLKRYGYVLATDLVPSPFLRGFAWHVRRALDTGAMARAAAFLRGKHDFSAFCAAPGRARDPVCAVRAVRVVARDGRVGVLMSGDAFLHHMVRNVVGTLVEVGLGRQPARWVADVLAGRDRRVAGPTAPADGLYLLRVLYPWSVFPGGRHLGRGRTPIRA